MYECECECECVCQSTTSTERYNTAHHIHMQINGYGENSNDWIKWGDESAIQQTNERKNEQTNERATNWEKTVNLPKKEKEKEK